MTSWLIDNQTSSLDHLIALLKSLQLMPNVIPFDKFETQDIAKSDLVILSGSSLYNASWDQAKFTHELTLISSHPGPLVGVCFGAQLIAHSYGAHLHKLPQKRYGLAHIKATRPDAPFIDEEYPVVFESHNWSIKHLPRELISLADSGAGVEILRHYTKPHYGLQFHPEAIENGNGRELFKRVLETIL